MALSTTRFNIVMEKVIRNIETNPNGTVFNRTRYCMANADILSILGLSVRAIGELVTQIKEAAVYTGLVTKKKQNKICENNNKYNKFIARSNNGRTSV
jgi:tRNA pseudouridine-54 N-methylase